MKEMLLCDIPIYGISKEKFDKRLNKKRQDYYEWILGNNAEKDEEKCKEWSRNYIVPYAIWKYNQMVGFVEILIQNYGVKFNIYMTEEKRHMCFSGVKKYYKNIYANGLSFHVGNKTNEEIRKIMLKYIDVIEKNFLKRKSLCMDKTVLENLLEYMDIKKMISDINK